MVAEVEAEKRNYLYYPGSFDSPWQDSAQDFKTLLELESKFYEHKDLKRFTSQYEAFKKSIDDSYVRRDCSIYLVDFLVSINEYEKAWIEWVKFTDEWNAGYDINTIIKFELLLNRVLVDGNILFDIAPKGHQLTSFGKRNMKDVLDIATTIIKQTSQKSFFERFHKELSIDLHQNTKKTSRFWT